MALIEDTLFGREDKVQKAVDRLKTFAPNEGYYLAFSGGKDSQCIYHLAKMADVKFDAHYSVTGVDPPELCQFIRKYYPDVKWEFHFWNDGKPEHYYSDGRPKQITMWSLIADHPIPPTRQARYCCTSLKESGGGGRVVVTGVRWYESQNRKKLHGVADIQTKSKKLHSQAEDDPSYRMNKSGGINFMDDNDVGRRMVEQCYQKNRTTINPIVDWTDADVWEFLNEVAKVPHCCLYDEGFTRLGCIGCPLQGKEGMLRDFERWPKFKALYIKAFDRMIANHPGEIKVADGTPVNELTDGGVQRYTQDGWLGTPDGFGNGFVQVTSESGDTATERERDAGGATSGLRTERNGSICGSKQGSEQIRSTASMVAGSDIGTKLPILDKQLLSGGNAADTHTHTQADAQAVCRTERSRTSRTVDSQNVLNGELYLTYWLWRCRSEQMDWSLHPLRNYDPRAEQYEGSLIQTHK